MKPYLNTVNADGTEVMIDELDQVYGCRAWGGFQLKCRDCDTLGCRWRGKDGSAFIWG